jgi:membrane-associated phospholipid phosphatase
MAAIVRRASRCGAPTADTLGAVIADLDWDVLRAVADLRAPFPDAVAEALSTGWSRVVFVAAAMIADLLARRFPFSALAVGVSIGLASAVTQPLKALFDRARPAIADPSFATLAPTPDNGAMPSGHASTAFAAAACVALLYPRLAAPALVLAAAVASSRVWLGVHYPTDVLAGWTAGAVIVLLYARLTRRVSPEPAAAAVDADPGPPRSDPPAAG